MHAAPPVSAQPRVNSLVEFLHERAPNIVSRLRQDHPAYDRQLDQGRILGTTAIAPEAANTFYADLTLSALKVARSRALPNMERLRERLQRAKRLRLVGSNVASVASLTVIGSLAAHDNAIALVPAVINLAALFTARWAEHLETDLHGGNETLIDTYDQLVSNEASAERLERAMHAAIATREQAESDGLVRDANQLIASLREIEHRLWRNTPVAV